MTAVHSFPDGLSPRVRGNHDDPVNAVQSQRSIPACAGEPILVMPYVARKRVYPRVCGGTSDRPAA